MYCLLSPFLDEAEICDLRSACKYSGVKYIVFCLSTVLGHGHSSLFCRYENSALIPNFSLDYYIFTLPLLNLGEMDYSYIC